MKLNKQDIRSEETKKSILSAAEDLFSQRGYEAVTMRDIAKRAGCSHTTIYIYFKNKEELLQQLAIPPLLMMEQQFNRILADRTLSPEDKLQHVSQYFIRFCLQKRNMYQIFFGAKSSRVDENDPRLEVQKQRNQLFGLLKEALRECLHIRQDEDLLLRYARIYFFTLHGIIGTYSCSEETVEKIMERLENTFNEAVDILLTGFNQKIKRGAENQ